MLDVISDHLAEFSNSTPQPSPRGTPRQHRLDATEEFNPPEGFSARRKHSSMEGLSARKGSSRRAFSPGESFAVRCEHSLTEACSVREGCSLRRECSVRNVKTWSGDGAPPTCERGPLSHRSSPRLQSPRSEPRTEPDIQSPRTETKSGSRFQNPRTEPRTQSPHLRSPRTRPKQVKLEQPHGASAMKVAGEVAKQMSHKSNGAGMPLNGPSSAYYL